MFKYHFDLLNLLEILMHYYPQNKLLRVHLVEFLA